MHLVRWDGESALRASLGFVALVVGGYIFATREPGNYLGRPALLLSIVGLWLLVLAVVPVLRAANGPLYRRTAITIASWAVVAAIWAVVIRVTT